MFLENFQSLQAFEIFVSQRAFGAESVSARCGCCGFGVRGGREGLSGSGGGGGFRWCRFGRNGSGCRGCGSRCQRGREGGFEFASNDDPAGAANGALGDFATLGAVDNLLDFKIFPRA